MQIRATHAGGGNLDDDVERADGTGWVAVLQVEGVVGERRSGGSHHHCSHLCIPLAGRSVDGLDRWRNRRKEYSVQPMCTTGVRRFSDGSYVLFKNKDFGRTHLDDRLWLDHDLFGVLGMTTWEGDDPSLDVHSGFSVGANRHGLLCCDSNVATLDHHVNYDVITEIALREGTDVATAVAAVRAACQRSPVSWANLVLIDAHSAAGVEIRGTTAHVVPFEGPTARSNHHVELGPHDRGQNSETSSDRLASAQRRVDAARDLDHVFELLSSHDGDGSGVCNHRDLTTVYSYVLHVHHGVCNLHVTQGQPCRNGRTELTIPFGDRFDQQSAATFLREYPTHHIDNAATAAIG